MITADIIIQSLHATSKKQAFLGIAQEAAPLFRGSAESLLESLLDRERIGSTGIGLGVAIPHVKIKGIERMYSVLARLDTPVDYDAIDGQPVDLIFMLLAPAESKMTQHLKTLAQISRFLKDSKTCAALREAKDRAEIQDILDNGADGSAPLKASAN